MRISDWSSDVCSSDLIRIAGQPLLRREQGRPAVQQIGVPLRGLPLGGGAGDALAHAQVVAAFLDPAPEARPGPQQGFVRDLDLAVADREQAHLRSEEHTSELQSLMRISYAVFCLTKKKST